MRTSSAPQKRLALVLTHKDAAVRIGFSRIRFVGNWVDRVLLADIGGDGAVPHPLFSEGADQLIQAGAYRLENLAYLASIEVICTLLLVQPLKADEGKSKRDMSEEQRRVEQPQTTAETSS